MTPPRLTLSPATLRSIVAVLDAQTDGFVALVRLAGLDRGRDFRGAILDGVDFGTDDVGGFDFSGADLTGADLRRAAGLDKIITDSNTRLPDHARRLPPDFDLDEAKRMILAGDAPPKAWRPLITELILLWDGWKKGIRDLSPLSELTSLRSLQLMNTRVNDVSPLSGLTALQRLDLRGTQVIDISPLSGLTALQSLDLADTQVSDVSSLRGLTSLQWLDLSGTRVNDLSAVLHVDFVQVDLGKRFSLELARKTAAPAPPLNRAKSAAIR
jgi:hypothetical protein